MPPAPLPENETQRLASLHALQILGGGPIPALDALAKAAALACNAPVALINLVDAERLWCRASYGVVGEIDIARHRSFCGYAILRDEILEVPDARADWRFADNPHVLGDAGGLRFYAGAPLKLPDGSIAGTLCVIGWEPMRMTASQREILRELAFAASQTLQRRSAGSIAAVTPTPGFDLALLDTIQAQGVCGSVATQRELLRVTLHAIGDAVITADPAGIVSCMNPAAERLTGWTGEEAVGHDLGEIFVITDEATGEPRENPVQACLQRRDLVLLNRPALLTSRNGERIGVEESAASIQNEDGKIAGVVLIFRDVTQSRRMSDEMTRQATHDPLTGLLNRGEFERRLSLLLPDAQADDFEAAVLFIDLDEFKLVNDTCGHPAGDALLVQISRLLISHVRASDAVARLGGDEFAILLDRCPMSLACQLAQRICDRMEAYRFLHDDQRFRIGASIGVAPVKRQWADTSAVLRAADACCSAAKTGGRNRVHAWSDDDHEMTARHDEMQWATRLEQALDDDMFVLFAQRIHPFDAACRGLHAEVLLRMQDTDGSLLPPGKFLPAAERFHIASRIDRWVLSKALAWMRGLPSVEAVDMLAINISGQSVGDAAFQAWTLAELSDAGPDIAQRICLEITETVAVTNLADASNFIDRLKSIGVRVALDDFGAGASSFGYLKSMGVDFLKIDGQFVRDILTDKLDEAAVRCFVQIAAVLGLRTIAEYTETEAVLEGLQAIGVDYAQGYHVHKPSPIEQLLAPVALIAAAAA